MLQINSTLFFQIVNFLLLVWILNRLIFRPFLRVIEEREKKTLGARTQASDLELQAKDLKEKHESGMSEARSRGLSEKEVIRGQGKAKGERILGEARLKSVDHISSMKRELEASVKEARRELVQLSISHSQEMAAKILGRNVQ